MKKTEGETHCSRVQEEISWARADELRAESRLHVLACEKCGKVATDMARLESAFQDAHDAGRAGYPGVHLAHSAVPVDFADRVMNRIACLDRRQSFWQRMRQSPPLRLRLAYASAVLLMLLGLAPSAI